jgi:hypothetical protein
MLGPRAGDPHFVKWLQSGHSWEDIQLIAEQCLALDRTFYGLSSLSPGDFRRRQAAFLSTLYGSVAIKDP